MAGGAGEHHFFVPPGDHRDFFGRFGVADEAEVGITGSYGCVHFLGAQVLDGQVRFGAALRKLLLKLGHFAETDGIDGGDADVPIHLLFQQVEGGFEFFLAA